MRKFLPVIIALLFVSVAYSATTPPRIGLIYMKKQAEELLAGNDTARGYRQAIEINGGRVVVLSQGYDDDFLKTHLDEIQGLLIPGGIDVDPKNYGEPVDGTRNDMDDSFDQFEFKVVKYAIEKKIPILGICRGHQILNVYLGGSLIQDIDTKYDKKDKFVHQVRKNDEVVTAFHHLNIDKNSILYKTLKIENIRVNTMHHQSVKKLGTGLRITSSGPDGIVESFESVSGPMILGVQFHPERLRLEDPRFDAIFVKLVDEAKKVKNKRALSSLVH